MRKWIIGVAMVLALLALSGGTALAALGLVETSTKAKGVTTITWDSSFADFDYTVGDTITMTVNWTVDAGAASYDSFALKRCTPRSKKDPALCEDFQVVSQSGTSVTVSFKFSDLHLDTRRNVDIGNAHFKLDLMVDTDGVGGVDTMVGYGVNVHVEDPQ